MRIRSLLLLLILVLPLSGQADPLFGKEMAGDRQMPRAFGIGIDYFNMSQPYQFDGSPSICEIDPCLSLLGPLLPSFGSDSGILIENEIENVDIKLDLWLLPFLNVFAVFGEIDGKTTIDLRNVDLSGSGIPALPPQLETIAINYDGDVYGGGLVLAVGGDKWFASITATFTETSLSGDFNSSVEATTIQPRIGVRATETTEVWLGGYFIDAEESHSDIIDLPLGPPLLPLPAVIPVDFAVNLSQQEDFNFSLGLHSMFSEHWEATVEIGGGDRNTALANLTYRF